MLLLFDIDATLTHTSGAGMRCLQQAGRTLFGEPFRIDGIDFAGRLDPLIISDLLVRNGHPDTREHHDAIAAGYERLLGTELARPGTARALPGVGALLDRLGREPGVILGLLTGNFAATGRLKLRACGIDPHRFEVAVWGHESASIPPRRSDLVPVGLARASARRGRPVTPREAVVIGDTPHDVHAARAHGCRSLGVATGKFTRLELQESGADLAVDDLSSTEEIAQWLLSPRRPD